MIDLPPEVEAQLPESIREVREFWRRRMESGDNGNEVTGLDRV